jgi:hypothetical protein
MVQAGLGKKRDPKSKITRAKRTAGMAKAVEHLHSKGEALTLNPSITKKIKKQTKNQSVGGLSQHRTSWGCIQEYV